MRLSTKSIVRNLLSFAAASSFVALSTSALAAEEADAVEVGAATATVDAATAAVENRAAEEPAEAKHDIVADEAAAPVLGESAEDVAAPIAKNAEKVPGKGDDKPAETEVRPVRTAPEATSTFSFAPAGSDRVTTPKDKDALRFGVLAGVGFPRPFAIGGFAKLHKVVGVGAEYSFMPQVTIAGAGTTFKGVSADLRVFPLKNAFFIGLRGGRQWLNAETTVTAGTDSSFETMEAATWFVNPRVGVLHTFKSGVTVGMDVGVQLPIAPSYTRTGRMHDTGLTSETDRTLATVANTLGNTTTVTVDLLRVGFMF